MAASLWSIGCYFNQPAIVECLEYSVHFYLCICRFCHIRFRNGIISNFRFIGKSLRLCQYFCRTRLLILELENFKLNKEFWNLVLKSEFLSAYAVCWCIHVLRVFLWFIEKFVSEIWSYLALDVCAETDFWLENFQV